MSAQRVRLVAAEHPASEMLARAGRCPRFLYAARSSTVLAGRTTGTPPKETVEMGDLIEAAGKSNVENGQGRKTKQFLRGFQARLDQHIAKGLAAAFAHEMRRPVFTDGELPGKIAQTDGVGLIRLDIAADHRPPLDQAVI